MNGVLVVQRFVTNVVYSVICGITHSPLKNVDGHTENSTCKDGMISYTLKMFTWHVSIVHPHPCTLTGYWLALASCFGSLRGRHKVRHASVFLVVKIFVFSLKLVYLSEHGVFQECSLLVLRHAHTNLLYNCNVAAVNHSF